MRAQRKTLRILKWKPFVASYDDWFKTYARQWGEHNDTDVVIDQVGLGELSTHAKAEAAAQQGHDLVLLLTPASTFEDDVIDHREIFEESVRLYGDPLDPAYRSCLNPTTGKHTGFCTNLLLPALTYRKDLWDTVGIAPDTWDDVRRGGGQIRLLHDRPVGISLAPEHNSEHSLRAIMYSFGASVQDGDGYPTLNSPRTVETIKYVKALYDEAMPEDVLSWNAVSNNSFMLSDAGCLTLDTISIVRAAESKQVPAQDKLRLARLPSGPVGRFGPAFGVDNFIIWKFSKNISGASQFLLDLVGNSRMAMVSSGFQHMPSYPGAVADLDQLVADDSSAAVPDQYRLLAGAGEWVTNIGHPGFANGAIGEVLDTHVLTRMFAQAATGAASPQAALDAADRQVRVIFQKWRAAGKI